MPMHMGPMVARAPLGPSFGIQSSKLKTYGRGSCSLVRTVCIRCCLESLFGRQLVPGISALARGQELRSVHAIASSTPGFSLATVGFGGGDFHRGTKCGSGWLCGFASCNASLGTISVQLSNRLVGSSCLIKPQVALDCS